MLLGNRDFNDIFNYDTRYLRLMEVIKKDPYRYLLSNREYENCYHRTKRALFYLGLPTLYLYRHLRHHQELSRVKNLSFGTIMSLQAIPRFALGFIVLYLLSYPLFVDYERLKRHFIAKIEIQKFDPEYFTYDDHKYGILNAPAYQSPESVWGRTYPVRLCYSYFQTAGWISRRREANPSLMEEVPPKYEFTPKGDRAGTDFKAIENKPLSFIPDSSEKHL